jgi:hypothetical protein
MLYSAHKFISLARIPLVGKENQCYVIIMLCACVGVYMCMHIPYLSTYEPVDMFAQDVYELYIIGYHTNTIFKVSCNQ